MRVSATTTSMPFSKTRWQSSPRISGVPCHFLRASESSAQLLPNKALPLTSLSPLHFGRAAAELNRLIAGQEKRIECEAMWSGPSQTPTGSDDSWLNGAAAIPEMKKPSVRRNRLINVRVCRAVEKVKLNSPNPSGWARNRAEQVGQGRRWRDFGAFSPDFWCSLRLAANFRQTTPSGMSCIPPAIGTGDAHQVVGCTSEQHLTGDPGTADQAAVTHPGDALEPAEDLLDAHSHGNGDAVAGVARGAPPARALWPLTLDSSAGWIARAG